MNIFGAIVGLLFPGAPSATPLENPQDLTPLFVVRPVAGQPFSANVVIWKRGPDGREETVTESVYVDAQGRMRYEQRLHEPVATISDSVAHEFALLSASGKVLVRSPLPVASDAVRPGPESGQSASKAAEAALLHPDAEDLGRRVIEGFDCRGYRKRDANGEDEVWTALPHGIVAFLRRTDASGREHAVVRLSNVKMGEPPAELFRIPPPIE
jgi:hypothetical protein